MSYKAPTVVETIEMEKSIYRFTAEKIVLIQTKDNAQIEVEDVKKEHEMLKKRKEYIPLRILVTPGTGTSVSKEVREYVNLPSSTEIVLCQAILVDNLAHKIIADFMMKLYPQKNNFKVFTKEKDAVNWLRDRI